jgi:uracil-DNA glycosylase
MEATHVISERDKFDILQWTIVECRKCPRLVQWRERVAREKVKRHRTEKYWGRPVPALGNPDASLIIIGLAPAAHGGNRTGRLFTGDRSGDWLFEAMHNFGFANQPTSISRDDGLKLHNALMTAALRCAPPHNKPLPEEMDNCRVYLRQELQLLGSKRVVVLLGLIAFRAYFRAWREIGGHMPLLSPKFSHGAEYVLPEKITVIASYHPSRQNTQTGRLTRAMFHQIFQRAREILDQ